MSRQTCCFLRGVGCGRWIGQWSKVDFRSLLSCVLAPLMSTPNGTPRPSVSTDRLTPNLPRSVGFLPVFSPAQWRLGHRPVHALPFPLDAFQFVVFQQRRLPQPAKDAPLSPFLKVAVQGAAGAEFAWSRFPLTAGPQDIEDAVSDLPQGRTRSAAESTDTILRQQRSHPLPHRVRKTPNTRTSIRRHRTCLPAMNELNRQHHPYARSWARVQYSDRLLMRSGRPWFARGAGREYPWEYPFSRLK